MTLLVVNARHIEAAPGRKTDVKAPSFCSMSSGIWGQ